MDTWLEIEMGNILKEEKALCQREWAGELGKTHPLKAPLSVIPWHRLCHACVGQAFPQPAVCSPDGEGLPGSLCQLASFIC